MLSRKSLLALSTDILKAVLGFVSTFFIAHYLGATALGTVGYLLGLLGTLALASDLGVHQAFRKCASEKPEDNGGYVSALIMAKLVLGLLLFGVCLGAPLAYPRLRSQLTAADVRGAYWAISAYYLLNNFVSVPALAFQARRETAKYAIPSTVGALVSSSVKIIMAVARVNLTALAIAYTLETGVGLVASLVLFRGYPLRRPSRIQVSHLVTYALPLVVVTTLAYILPNVDRILVENFWGAREVGFYTAVLGVVALMQRVPLAAMTIFLPQASEDAAKGDLREVRRRLFVLERYLLMMTVPLSVAVAMSSAVLTRLCLGEDFLRSGPILAVLSLNPLLTAFFEPYNTIVYAVEKHRYLLLSSVTGLVVLLAADLVLVPRVLLGATMLGLGGVGAAFGALASQVVTGFFQVALVRRYARIGLYRNVAKFLAAGATMAAVTASIQWVMGLEHWWGVAVALPFGAATYLAALALMRQFSRADAQLFLDLLHPGKMASYVFTELSNENPRG